MVLEVFKKLKLMLYELVKRIFDIIVGIIGIIFLIPICLILKIIYIIKKDTGKIFYTQIRIGKNGKKFKIYKFRTMVPNADEELKKLLKQKKYKKEWDKNQKINNDPRITNIGKILRRCSFDEVPQFINVFIGNMSLVGPRPLIEGELLAHKGNPQIYESVKPGMTGWWTSNGGGLTYKKRLESEYYYIRNRGLIMDIRCILKTSLVVFKNNRNKVVK